jgi:hypothetical protein
VGSRTRSSRTATRQGAVDLILEAMAVLLEAINIKRKTVFEYEGVPFVCLESDIINADGEGWVSAGAFEDSEPADECGV